MFVSVFISDNEC